MLFVFLTHFLIRRIKENILSLAFLTTTFGQGNNIFYSVNEISFLCCMAPLGFNNDQSTVRRVILGCIYTLKIKIPKKDST